MAMSGITHSAQTSQVILQQFNIIMFKSDFYKNILYYALYTEPQPPSKHNPFEMLKERLTRMINRFKREARKEKRKRKEEEELDAMPAEARALAAKIRKRMISDAAEEDVGTKGAHLNDGEDEDEDGQISDEGKSFIASEDDSGSGSDSDRDFGSGDSLFVCSLNNDANRTKQLYYETGLTTDESAWNIMTATVKFFRQYREVRTLTTVDLGSPVPTETTTTIVPRTLHHLVAAGWDEQQDGTAVFSIAQMQRLQDCLNTLNGIKAVLCKAGIVLKEKFYLWYFQHNQPLITVENMRKATREAMDASKSKMLIIEKADISHVTKTELDQCGWMMLQNAYMMTEERLKRLEDTLAESQSQHSQRS